ncbi:precorrin-6y C5,15-methyltransferase (decarboxylating) subunit CbiE [Conexivisphaera calida]|uniref:Cobalt-precorrin-6y C5-methyltransferase n=1 Tax=Conexivisphaera calida TaxID=1874277 RepID=A0A4P2VCX1_9ARCH|nr:precorrin-6y C5,15-methyltransferase (decarboxylating) subunit CbiE [Conexivisphaera calida]BBE42384.1 Cobalt-precorrin-6y C5-methyltransferase [Conexivisphaera calida]
MGGTWIVGVGPGDPGYITAKATRLIEEADCVAGFKPALRVIEGLVDRRVLTMDYDNEKTVLEFIASEAKTGKKCVIVCYGDPNFSDKQFVEKIRSACGEVEVVPGISSVQVACARAEIPMEESIFIAFHKSGPIDREKEELLRAVKEGHRNIIVLPRPWDFMPQHIAKFLTDKDVSIDLEVTIYENLTLKDERVHIYRLGYLLNTGMNFSDLTIMIFKGRRSVNAGGVL